MSAHPSIIAVLVWATTVSGLFSCVAMLAVRDTFPRLHFMAPVANVSAVALVIAVALQEGWGQALVKAILIAGVMIVMNAVLAHATARAAQVREFGQWTPQVGETLTTSHSVREQHNQAERRSNE